MYNYQSWRAQVFPTQAIGILIILSCAFFLMNYAYLMKSQISAQNDADAAARLAAVPQATQYNEISLAMYAADVEEYRARVLLNALLMNVRGVGGCDADPASPIPEIDPVTGLTNVNATGYNCDVNYPRLRSAYFESVQRYTHAIGLIEAVSDYTETDELNSSQAIVKSLQNSCADSGDCSMHYFLSGYQRRDHVGQAKYDAASYALRSGWSGTYIVNPIFIPHVVDVTVCKVVPPLIHSMFSNQNHSITIIARSAATPIATTEEWFSPGTTLDPLTHQAYQPTEYYTERQNLDPSAFDYNSVQFPSEHYSASFGTGIYTKSQGGAAYTAYTAWWNIANVHPVRFSPTEKANFTAQLAAFGCTP